MQVPTWPSGPIRPMVSLMHTSSKEGVRSDRQVFHPRLIGESSAQRFTANSIRLYLCRERQHYHDFAVSGNYARRDSVQRCALASLQPCSALLDYSLVCSLTLFLTCLASGLHHSTDSLVITCYMRVFDTNTFAGTYLAFWPFSLLGSHPLPRKRE